MEERRGRSGCHSPGLAMNSCDDDVARRIRWVDGDCESVSVRIKNMCTLRRAGLGVGILRESCCQSASGALAGRAPQALQHDARVWLGASLNQLHVSAQHLVGSGEPIRPQTPKGF